MGFPAGRSLPNGTVRVYSAEADRHGYHRDDNEVIVIESYLPIAILAGLIAVVVGGMLVGSIVLGPKRRTKIKQQPFECGMTPFELPGDRFHVKFYLIAILFIIFDVDLAFLFPWAVVFRELGMYGFISMLVFLGFVGVGLAVIWKKGAFKWQ
jgi:NADH-quinone oxidoreductase subunit A